MRYARLFLLPFTVAAVCACAALTSAEKAAPACYGLTTGSLSTVVTEGETVVQNAEQCKADSGDCSDAIAGALSTLIAYRELDEQAAECVVEAIRLFFANPSGGEAPYSPPDAGPPAMSRALARGVVIPHFARGPDAKALAGIARWQTQHASK